MDSVVVRWRERTKSNVSTAMVLWALAIDVVIWLRLVERSGGAVGAGFVVTALFGAYLGWRRRVGTVWVAPVVSWLFGWFPTVVAAMVHFGALRGFLLGLVLVTFGWVGIGFVEFAWLGMVALFVRTLRGPAKPNEIVLFGPGDEDEVRRG